MKLMNCPQCQDQMFEYLDGTLSACEREQFVVHLAACPVCAALVEVERAAVKRVAATATEFQLSPATRTRLTALLRAARPQRFAWWPVLVPVAAAVVAISVWRWQSSRHEPSWIECRATTYSETHPDQWVRRSLLVYRRNGSESFLQITVKRPEL